LGFALTLTLTLCRKGRGGGTRAVTFSSPLRQGEGIAGPRCSLLVTRYWFFAEVEDGDDVGVGAEAAHGLGLAGDAVASGVVQAVGLNQGEGDVAVEEGVVGEEDAFFAALAEEALDGVTAVGERRGD